MRTILVVDDDECFHFLCEMAFQQSGEEIDLITAYDGVEALERLADPSVPSPDLILLDINMPRMNGHEFLAKYAETNPGETSVVAMLTSSDQQTDRQNAMSYGFVRDYLLKPLRPEDIPRLKIACDSLSSSGIE